MDEFPKRDADQKKQDKKRAHFVRFHLHKVLE